MTRVSPPGSSFLLETLMGVGSLDRCSCCMAWCAKDIRCEERGVEPNQQPEAHEHLCLDSCQSFPHKSENRLFTVQTPFTKSPAFVARGASRVFRIRQLVDRHFIPRILGNDIPCTFACTCLAVLTAADPPAHHAGGTFKFVAPAEDDDE